MRLLWQKECAGVREVVEDEWVEASREGPFEAPLDVAFAETEHPPVSRTPALRW